MTCHACATLTTLIETLQDQHGPHLIVTDGAGDHFGCIGSCSLKALRDSGLSILVGFTITAPAAPDLHDTL